MKITDGNTGTLILIFIDFWIILAIRDKKHG